jgi:hypothetical protein
VSAVATPSRVETGTLRSASLSDRLLAAVPLTLVYTVLCGVYVVEAWKRVTPWLFTDELELTTLSRSIAETGHPSRLGRPHGYESLYTVVTAPVWRIAHVASAYAALKYFDVFVMTSVVFPTYFLARFVVGRRAALFAAAGAAVIPSLAYSSYIVEEPLAYPFAALCLLLIAKAVLTWRLPKPSGWMVAAVVAAAIAPAVKGELVVIQITFVLTAVFMWWSSDRMLARRARWTPGDWLGALTLAAGAIVLISGIASHHSHEWLMVTAYNWTKKRIFLYGDWAAGSLAIGLGLLPFVLGLAALVRAPGEPRSREQRIFRSVAGAGVIAFGIYAAMKAAYLSMTFATRVEERNLTYISPLLFIGTAVVLERRRVRLWALAVATAYTCYLVVGTPYFMDRQLYSDALGLAILEQGNRYLLWTPTFAKWLLLGILFAGIAVVVVFVRLRSRTRLAAALAVALGAGAIGWSFTGEMAAAAGTNSLGHAAAATLRTPFDWVDARTHGESTLYLAQGVGDPTSYELLAFWNRTITRLSSLDATVNGPVAYGGPNISAKGELYWSNDPTDFSTQYAYAVEDWPCVDFAGTKRAQHDYRAGGTFQQWRLIQLTPRNRLRAFCSGIYPDGWSGADDSAYFRFPGGKRGWLRIVVSRRDWGGKTGPSPFHVLIGPIKEDTAHNQPVLARVSRQINGTIDSLQTKTIWLPTPGSSFAAKVVVAKKFVPRDVDPVHLSDARALGAEVSYSFFTSRPSAKRHK